MAGSFDPPVAPGDRPESLDAAAMKVMFDSIYGELKRLARRRHGGMSHTLNTTGLVHETYLKLHQAGAVRVRDREHFFALAARAMRQIAIDVARARFAGKRGGVERHVVELEEADDLAGIGLGVDELVRLDSALDALEARDKELADLVELRVFAGLTIAEIADLRGVGARTVDREWRRARTYLFDALSVDDPVD